MLNPSPESYSNPAHRRLLSEIRKLNFGRIEDLHVRDGLPVFTPPPRLVREVKLGGGRNGPLPDEVIEESLRKPRTRELLEQISRLHDGVVLRLEVKHGQPLWMHIEERPRG